MLVSTPKEFQTFNDADAAVKFLIDLNPDIEQLRELSTELDINEAPENSTSKAYFISIIGLALASGEIIISVDKFSSPPAAEEVVEESTGDEAGNRDAAIVTAGNVNTQNESIENNKVEDIICELTEFTAKCKHEKNRIVTMTDKSAGIIVLEVVASETHKEDFEKITTTIKGNALCGEHIGNSSTISPTPVSMTKSASSNIYTLACAPFTSPLQNIWLSSVEPTSYKIAPNTQQAFDPSAIKIDVYPKIKRHGELGYSFGS